MAERDRRRPTREEEAILRARRLRELQEKVKNMVEANSKRAAGVLKGWIKDKDGGR